MTELNDLKQLVEEVGTKATSAFEKMLSPEVTAQMSSEQKRMVANAKNAFDFKGVDLANPKLDLDAKMNTLQTQLNEIQNAISVNR